MCTHVGMSLLKVWTCIALGLYSGIGKTRNIRTNTHKNVPADACNRTTCMRPRIQNCRDQMAGNYLVVARPRHLLKTKGKRYISTSIVLGDMCISDYQCL